MVVPPFSRFDWQQTPATSLPLPKCQQRSFVPHFCSVLFTLSRAKDSSQAAPSRLVLLRQRLKNTQTWLVLDWCSGYCDWHVSLFPYQPGPQEAVRAPKSTDIYGRHKTWCCFFYPTGSKNASQWKNKK